MRVAALVLALALLLCLGSRPALAQEPDPPEVEAHRLVHLLGYVAADYPRAIKDGAVLSWDEYEEQLEIAEEADRVAARLELSRMGKAPPVDLCAAVGKMRVLVWDKAAPEEVAAKAAAAAELAVRAFRVEQAPAAAPSAARGKELYAEHCATCHGETGRADTQRAATLEPRPANFLDPAIGEGLTPFRVATTVRFGVLETAMVPFTFLSDADRWSIAFHVASLRHAAEPAPGAPTYALDELAMRSDAELREDLAAAGIVPERHDGILADLRRNAPYEDRALRSPLGLARAKLTRARAALGRDDRSAARSLVLDAYLDGLQPAAAALARADAAAARSLEDDVRALREEIDAGTTAAAEARVDRLLASITRGESALSAAPPGSSSIATLAAAALGIGGGIPLALLVGGALAFAARAGISGRGRLAHVGWAAAILLAIVAGAVSLSLGALPGARRVLIEGVLAALGVAVIARSSYRLLVRRDAAAASPPRAFFRVSGLLLGGLAVVLAFQSVAAFRLAGVVPSRAEGGPAVASEAAPAGPFPLTVRLLGPEVNHGWARIFVGDDERVVRFGARNEAVFPDLPAEYRERAARLEIITVPELEPTWEPTRLFPLVRGALEVHVRPEKGKYDVVAIYRTEPGAPRQTARLQGFNLGEEVTAATFVSRAVAGVRIVRPEIPPENRFTLLSAARKRWLRPLSELEHTEMDETIMVLVDAEVRKELGDDPAPYVRIADEVRSAPPP
jgi:high-affinity iron transporter